MRATLARLPQLGKARMKMPLRHVVGAICAIALLAQLDGCATAPRESVSPATSAHTCTPAPLKTPLFLRGTMNTWTTQELDAFVYDCDAYTLDVDLHGSQDFRIADEKLSGGLNFGAARAGRATLSINQPFALASLDATNLHFDFAGAYTLRLVLKPGIAGRPASATLTIVPLDQARSKPAITDPIARSLHFDSRDVSDKTPFGAVAAGTEVTYQLDAMPGVDAAALVIEKRKLEGPQEVLEYHEVARVPLARTRAGERETWRGRYRYDEIGVFGYHFLVEIGGKKYRYENNRDRVHFTREAGSGGLGLVENGDSPHAVRRFRQTVYRGDFHVPDWARDAVFYYIFPERFRNGDTRNDPKPGVDTYQNHTVEFHRNWLDKPYLPGTGDGSDSVYANDFFGGDLAGIVEKLDYIQALGANALYINPVFRAASNHKYDTADYTQIDPHFGTNDDFVRLCREAARRGMRVILDTSLNHTGSDSLYFDRYDKFPGIGAFKGEHIRADSPWADWYHFDPTQHDPAKQYRGWMGTPDLPELNKASPSYRTFAYGAPDSVMKQWLDRGAAGWRMDVAPWVPDDFWREWRIAVKGHKSDALTIAETFFDASKFFLGDEFDSTMDYIFLGVAQDFANGGDARAAYRDIELMRENYPRESFYALMNLIDSHDLPRALYKFGYRDERADAATIVRAKQRLHLALLFQMIFPGAPAVYYGDEVGMTGGEDPYNRGAYPWVDRGGKPDLALLADYKKLIHLRRDHAILRHGSLDAPVYLDEHVIALLRRDGTSWAITALNNDVAPHRVSIPVSAQTARLRDVLNGGTVDVANGNASFEVPAMSGVVLIDVSSNRVNLR
jgi:glycosidase